MKNKHCFAFLFKLVPVLLFTLNGVGYAAPTRAKVDTLDSMQVAATKYEMRKDFGKAIKIHDRILALDSTVYLSQFKKAQLLSWMKRLDESIALFENLVRHDSVPPGMKLNSRIRLAEVKSWKGEFTEAIDLLDKVLALDPKNIEARLYKGEILEWSGKFKEAKNVYRDILLIDPENLSGKARLETLLWVK